MWTTHEVFNQTQPLLDVNAWHADRLLRTHAQSFGATHADFTAVAAALGGYVGSAAAIALADQANRNKPILHTHDRCGEVLDEVSFHPAYHELMRVACRHGVKSWCWAQPRSTAGIERALLVHLWNGFEQGTACPMTMSFAAVPMVACDAALHAQIVQRLIAQEYVSALAPLQTKAALTIGMAMTEKQGGSDLRASRTTATYDPAAGEWPWRLVGHKWFCSAPMSDGFFTLANTDAGLSCFFVPRMLEASERNQIRVRRLKDKLGNHSNASSEIEYQHAHARLIGEPGRGIRTLIGMAQLTRFDIVCAVPGMMRAALVQALHHARHREAFGSKLIDQALMRNVLADLALEWEAAVLLALELARAFSDDGTFADRGRPRAAAGDTHDRALARILTPAGKYWLCKRLVPYVAECMECLGGNGYVEDWPLARWYREAPLNGIWEGSANVICLDVLRSASRDAQAVDAFASLVAAAQDSYLDATFARLRTALRDPDAEAQARHVVEQLALTAQAALLRRHAPGTIADIFIATRLRGEGSRAFGTLPNGAPLQQILERAAWD